MAARAALLLVLLAGSIAYADANIVQANTPRREQTMQELVAFVDSHTEPDECLWTWGALNEVNFLAARDNCTAAVLDSVLMVASQYPVAHNRNEYMEQLFQRPPALHVVRSDWGYFPALEAYAARYRGPLAFDNSKFQAYSVNTSMMNAADVNFGGKIQLMEYDLAPADATCAGDALELAMTWRQLAVPTHDYQMFVKLLTADERAEIASYDGPPADDPTSSWVDKGQIILGGRFGLRVPEATEPGRYKLVVGLYDVATSERVPARRDGQETAGYAVLRDLAIEAC